MLIFFILIVIMLLWQCLGCFSRSFADASKALSTRNPSAQAVEIAAGGEPPWKKSTTDWPCSPPLITRVGPPGKKSRCGTLEQTPDSRSLPPLLAQSSLLHHQVLLQWSHNSSLPQGVFDQLFARVADKVTRRCLLIY